MALAWYYRDQHVRSRHSEDGHLDLCDWLADHGATRSSSLDAVARLIGLPGKTGVDGSRSMAQGTLAPDAYLAATTALLDALAADGRVGDVLSGIDRPHLTLA